ncbi:uncharacterized protein LOC141529296 [Cotesia typhae]|uniref:uncharacterized protein LOC141529296 n=1 Tax=Cotesia typhae TaxID=2053667 RepID=UPI003D69AD2A
MTETSKTEIDFTSTSNEEVDSFTHGDTMVLGGMDRRREIVEKQEEDLSFYYDEWNRSQNPNLGLGSVIKFERLKCQNADPNFAQAAEDVAPIELTITGSTTKVYANNASQGPRVYEPISIPRVYEEFGIVCVQGFIRDLFEDITFNNTIYGAGSITDGEYRVKVQVRSFSGVHDSLKKYTLGVHVEVKGQVNRDKTSAFPYVQCNSMSDVKIVDDKVMNAADVKKGFRIPANPSPKRIRIEQSTTKEMNGKTTDQNNMDAL